MQHGVVAALVNLESETAWKKAALALFETL
jgi:hypothetical protein